jgi:hypothetical protein
MKPYAIGLILFFIFTMNNVYGQQTDREKTVLEKWKGGRTEQRLKDLEQYNQDSEDLNLFNSLINNNKTSEINEEVLTNRQLINNLISKDKDIVMLINNLYEKVIFLEDSLYSVNQRVKKLERKN